MPICAILYARDYAGLVGLAPEKFLNRFFKRLGGFTLNDRGIPEQLAAWMQYRFEKLRFRPEVKFEVEVIESPRGKFRSLRPVSIAGRCAGSQGKIELTLRKQRESPLMRFPLRASSI